MSWYVNSMMQLSDKVLPEHTALLVIDIQRDFAAPDGMRAKHGGDLSQVELMIDNLERLIVAAQSADVLTLYTQQIYDRDKLNDLQKEQYDLDDKLVMCDPITHGPEFYRVKPENIENVYTKYNYNAFSNPKFTEKLQQNKVKTLVITGMDTYYCVETAIRNGYDLGYKIVVPSDGVAGNARHLPLHERTLELVKKSYGVVTNCDELISLWTT